MFRKHFQPVLKRSYRYHSLAWLRKTQVTFSLQNRSLTRERGEGGRGRGGEGGRGKRERGRRVAWKVSKRNERHWQIREYNLAKRNRLQQVMGMVNDLMFKKDVARAWPAVAWPTLEAKFWKSQESNLSKLGFSQTSVNSLSLWQ